MSGKARTKFIASIASAMFCYKQHPTKVEYRHVAHQIVQKYPFMGQQDNLDHLVTALEVKFKYMRNYSGGAVKVKKTDAECSVKAPSKRVYPKAPSFLIVDENDFDDEPSQKRRIESLKREASKKKGNRDDHSIADLMEKLYPYRRRKIQESPVPVVTLIKDYPPLSEFDEIVKEFNKVMGQEISRAFDDTFEELQEKMLAVIKPINDNHNLEKIRALLETDEDMTADSKVLFVLCCLTYLLPDCRLKPDHTLVIHFVPENTSLTTAEKQVQILQPCIVVRGKMSTPKDAYLIIERTTMCKLTHFEQIPLALVASFYTFNMHYTSGLVNFYTFLECYFMKYKVPKERARVGHLMAQLQATTV